MGATDAARLLYRAAFPSVWILAAINCRYVATRDFDCSARTIVSAANTSAVSVTKRPDGTTFDFNCASIVQGAIAIWTSNARIASGEPFGNTAAVEEFIKLRTADGKAWRYLFIRRPNGLRRTLID